jgi:hypothetical protein
MEALHGVHGEELLFFAERARHVFLMGVSRGWQTDIASQDVRVYERLHLETVESSRRLHRQRQAEIASLMRGNVGNRQEAVEQVTAEIARLRAELML